MRRIQTALFLSALCLVARAQAKSAEANADLRGPVRTVTAEVAEFEPGGGKSAEGRRVPLQSLTYDARGNVVKRTDFNWDGSASQTLVYTYDAQGRETGYEEYTGTLSTPRKHVYVLDADGRRVEYRIVQPDGAAGEKHLYKYDADGRPAEEALHEHKGALISRTVYAYDEQGRQTSRTSYNADGSLSSRSVSTYDAAGRLVERARHDYDLLTYRVRYAYDGKGRPVERETVGSVVEADFPTSEVHAPGKTLYKYKGKERPSEAVTHAADGAVREKVTTEYDSRGNWVKRTRLIQPAGGRESRRVEYRAITYF